MKLCYMTGHKVA